MEVTFRKEKNATVISVKGRMDALCFMDFERILDEQIGAGENRFIIDFTDLDYISSAGLQCILAAAKKLEPRGGDLLLSGLKGTVREVFDISGFSSIFTIADSLDEALAQS